MKILVVNLHAMSNRGDAVINYVTLDFLRRAFPNAHITLAANHPAEFVDLGAAVVPSFKTWVWSTDERQRFVWHPLHFVWLLLAALSLCYWRFTKRLPPGWPGTKRALLQAYVEADLVVSCGGNTLYARHPLALAFWIICFAQWCSTLCRTPLVLLPQTIGPFWGRVHVWAARQTLKSARLIMLRDEESRRLATDVLRLPAECSIVAADMALFFGDVVSGTSPATRQDRLIGISVLDWGVHMPLFGRQAEYEAAIAGAVTTLVAQGYQVAFLVQSDTAVWGENDEVPIKRIIARLDDASQAAVKGAWTVPLQKELILQFYGQFQLMIATRMHAVILSLAAGTPVVPIAYTSKNWAFVHATALEPITLDIATVESDAIIAAVTTVLNNYDCWQKQLATLVEGKRAQVNIVSTLREAMNNNA
jgi:colanic acid/amylovoran biosynthesis protein